MRNHLKTPIFVPRWLLSVKYALFALLGLAVAWNSTPTLDAVLPEWYTFIWAILICASSISCLVSSLREDWEHVERWSVTILAVLITVYAVAPIVLAIQGDSGRAALAVTALALSVIPIARSVQLIRKVDPPW